MNQPITPPTPNYHDRFREPGLPPTLPALVASVIGIVAGVLLTKLVLSIGIYMPIVGFTIGYGIHHICRRGGGAISVIAVLTAFLGTLITETFIYVNDSRWDYLINFYANGTVIDWLYRIINPIIAFSYTRGFGVPSVPAPPDAVQSCPQCRSANTAAARFCSSCGAPLV